MSKFVHLRVHSKFSVGHSILTIKEISELCKINNMQACALTDINLMSGQAEFSDVMPKNKIQPIIGVELSVNHNIKNEEKIRKEQLSNLVLLAKNKEGYLNLCELSRIMYMRQNAPCVYVNISDLKNNSNGIICLSGGITGPIGLLFFEHQIKEAKFLTQELNNIFKDNFYIEIERHGLEKEIITEPFFLDLAKEFNIPIVATNNVYFANKDTYEATDALSCVLEQTKVIRPDRDIQTSEAFFKSEDEMCKIFEDLEEAIENTVNIAKRCAFYVNVKEKPLLPNFLSNFDEESKMLHDLTFKGLDKLINKYKIQNKEEYYEQAEFELKTIIQMGFPGYFLIVADYINWCRNNNILVGPGRGSGAGSVVTWSLGITSVNPLKYGLLFERFLNPDRISMPDIDTDFEPAGLEKVLKYVQDKYGYESVCKIITFGGLYAKGAVRDIGRVYGVPYSKTDKLAKLIPNDTKTLKEAVDKTKDIQDVISTDIELKNVVNIAQELEGSVRNLGQHACGVVIGDRKTTLISPVYRDPVNVLPSCQFDGHYLEATGLIKFDFLGLETLSVLKYTTELIAKNSGVKIDIDAIPTDDKKTLKLFQDGLTEGVFQFDAPHVKQILKKMKPTSFLHLVALNALNRPGPIAFIPQFIARMHGEEEIKYIHPKAESVLKETYGVIVYQEQVMTLTRVLAGFSRGKADNVRKAMGKKIIQMMNDLEVEFLNGCVQEKTLSQEQAKDLWNQFKEFAKYAFNKSHSVAYSIIANQCAYLKANYPAEFLAASMSSNLNDTKRLQQFYDDAKLNFNITIVPPDINLSEGLFTVKNKKIYYGLSALKGVGLSAVNSIIQERDKNGKFLNLNDFCIRCQNVINKRIFESFIKAGVFDSFDKNRAKLYHNMEKILLFFSKTKTNDMTLSLFANTTQDKQNTTYKLKDFKSWSNQEQLDEEQSIIGFYISAHPLDSYKEYIKHNDLITSKKFNSLYNGDFISMLVFIDSFNKKHTKTGKEMLVIKASDIYGNIDAVYFGQDIKNIINTISDEKIVILNGKLNKKNDKISIFVNSIHSLEESNSTDIKQIGIVVSQKEHLKEIQKILNNTKQGNIKVNLILESQNKKLTIQIPKMLDIKEKDIENLSQYGQINKI